MADKLIHSLMENIKKESNYCLSENTISEFIENKLSKEEREKVLKHLNICDRCFEIYSLTTSTYYEVHRINKTKRIKYLSIAASIIIVLFIGVFYKSSYKAKPKTYWIFKKNSVKAELKQKKVRKKTSNRLKTKKQEKITSLSLKEKKLPKKTEEKEDKLSISEPKKEKTKYRKPSVKLSKTILAETKSIQTADESRVGMIKTESKKNAAKMNFQRLEQIDINKEYSLLVQEGYFYKGKNHFKERTVEKLTKILTRWKKIYPYLIGEKKLIAEETINYLKDYLNL